MSLVVDDKIRSLLMVSKYLSRHLGKKSTSSHQIIEKVVEKITNVSLYCVFGYLIFCDY